MHPFFSVKYLLPLAAYTLEFVRFYTFKQISIHMNLESHKNSVRNLIIAISKCRKKKFTMLVLETSYSLYMHRSDCLNNGNSFISVWLISRLIIKMWKILASGAFESAFVYTFPNFQTSMCIISINYILCIRFS